MPTIDELKAAAKEAKTPEPEEAVAMDEVVPHVAGKTGYLRVTKMWKDSGEVKSEDSDEELIDVQISNPLVTMATVSFHCDMSLNLGNYETVKVGVFASVPCYVEEMDDAFLAAKKFVDLRLNKEVKSIRDYREKKRGGE